MSKLSETPPPAGGDQRKSEPKNRWLGFSERTRAVFEGSLEEAAGFVHRYIGEAELFLGLFRDKDMKAALASANLTADQVRDSFGFNTDRERYIGMVGFTHEALKVVKTADYRRDDMGDAMIEPWHLGIAFIDKEDGIIVKTLQRLDVDLEDVRGKILGVPLRLAQQVKTPLDSFIQAKIIEHE